MLKDKRHELIIEERDEFGQTLLRASCACKLFTTMLFIVKTDTDEERAREKISRAYRKHLPSVKENRTVASEIDERVRLGNLTQAEADELMGTGVPRDNT